MSLEKKHPEVDVNQSDSILSLINEMKDVLVDSTDSQAELKEKQVKMEEDLKAHISSSDARFNSAEASLSEYNAEQEALTQSIFDVVVKDAGVRNMWGYNDPISRALYKPTTQWEKGKGWTSTGKGYNCDPVVMELNDALYLAGMHKAVMSQRHPSDTMTYTQAVKSLDSYNLFRYEIERNSELRKAMDSATTGEGLEWVPTQLSAKLIDDIRLAMKVTALFPSITMPAGVGSFEVPVRGARRESYLVGEATADTGNTAYGIADPPSIKVAFTAVKHGLRMLFSDELEEDSAIAIMPLVRAELVQSLADASETAIINGDTANTHQDSNVTAATSVEKSWDGLRKLSGGSGGSAAVDIATLSLANLRSIRQGMGRFGTNPAELDWIVGLSGYIQLLGLSEVVTIDKFGANATAQSGVLGMLDGIPVVVSEFIKQDLNATGVHDGVTTSKTVMLLANNTSFYVGEKPGGVKVETDRDITIGQNIVVATHRSDFQEVVADGSGEQNVGLGYNLTS